MPKYRMPKRDTGRSASEPVESTFRRAAARMDDLLRCSHLGSGALGAAHLCQAGPGPCALPRRLGRGRTGRIGRQVGRAQALTAVSLRFVVWNFGAGFGRGGSVTGAALCRAYSTRAHLRRSVSPCTQPVGALGRVVSGLSGASEILLRTVIDIEKLSKGRGEDACLGRERLCSERFDLFSGNFRCFCFSSSQTDPLGNLELGLANHCKLPLLSFLLEAHEPPQEAHEPPQPAKRSRGRARGGAGALWVG